MALTSERSRGIRNAIQDAATLLFLQRGYGGASMDDVAAAARVSKQTVYKHFSSKEKLFTQIVLDTTSRIDALVDEVVDRLRDPDDLERALLELAHRFTAAVLEPDTLRLRRLVIATAEQFPALGASWYENGFERVLATLADCFTRLADAGRLEIEDAELAAQHFVGLLLWIPVNRAMFTGELEPAAATVSERQHAAAVAAFLRAYGRHDA